MGARAHHGHARVHAPFGFLTHVVVVDGQQNCAVDLSSPHVPTQCPPSHVTTVPQEPAFRQLTAASPPVTATPKLHALSPLHDTLTFCAVATTCALVQLPSAMQPM